jgi:hypothetical protein
VPWSFVPDLSPGAGVVGPMGPPFPRRVTRDLAHTRCFISHRGPVGKQEVGDGGAVRHTGAPGKMREELHFGLGKRMGHGLAASPLWVRSDTLGRRPTRGTMSFPRKDKVIGFQTSFSLTRAEANEVVDAVGTAP